MRRKINKRVLYVGLPLFILMLPVVVGSFLVAMARDAARSGWKLYDDIGDWVRK